MGCEAHQRNVDAICARGVQRRIPGARYASRVWDDEHTVVSAVPAHVVQDRKNVALVDGYVGSFEVVGLQWESIVKL